MRTILALAAIASFGMLFAPAGSCGQHDLKYEIILPSGYIGWVRLDFEVRSAPELDIEDTTNTVTVVVPESGIVETSSLFVLTVHESYSLYYKADDRLDPVPRNLYSKKWMMDGFPASQFDAAGKPRALSWYFFVGPRALRSKEPSGSHIPTYARLPTPGRIDGASR